MYCLQFTIHGSLKFVFGQLFMRDRWYFNIDKWHFPNCINIWSDGWYSMVRTIEYRVDVLCLQPIKLFQVVSTSEFHEYWWNNVAFIFFVLSGFWRASEASNNDCFKKKVWKIWTKNSNSSLKNKYFGVLIFLEREFFDP